MSNTLQQLREQLDEIDSQIVKLIEKRFKITDDVAVYKDSHDIPLTDVKREVELLNSIRDKIKHPVLKENISEIYETVFRLNKTARVFKKSKKISFKKIGIIGIGLIGGSIIKGLKMKNPELEILTVRRDSEDISLALKQGYLSKSVETVEQLVEAVELIILASPIHTILPLAKQISKCETGKCVVIDIASIKSSIVNEFSRLNTANIEFCGTHPMGGSEKMGFQNSQGMLFVGKPWIITPTKHNSEATIKRIEEFVQYLGSNVVITTAKKHDQYTAGVSHMIFLLSTYMFAYIYTKENEALELAGSGFQSLTRLASGSPQMHTDIIAQNYDNIAVSMVAFMEFIKQHNLANDTLLQFFQNTKRHRDKLYAEKT